MGWFKRRERKATLEEIHLARLIAMFEALPKPKIEIPRKG
jgi:hypothetical protein